MTNTITTTSLRTLAADIVSKALKAGASDAEVTIREGDEFSTTVRMGQVETNLHAVARCQHAGGNRAPGGAGIGSIQAGIGPSIEGHGGRARSDHAHDNPENLGRPWYAPGGEHRAGERERERENGMLPLDHLQRYADAAKESHSP